MAKILKIALAILILLTGVWYFLIKDYDYKITFKTPQATGIVYSSLLEWNNWEASGSKAVITVTKQPFSNLEQELKVSDSIINIKWEIVRESDSITKVSAYLTDKNNSLLQKLKAPFGKSDFVKRGLSTVKRIQKELKEIENRYRVGRIEMSKIPKQYCAYVSLESKLNEKANQMMGSNAFIITYFEDNNIEIIGNPFLEVTHWNEQENTVAFNFCFPIAFNENYKNSEDLKFKMTEEKPALKVLFNGNYRISDCAWFSIMDYAKRNKIDIEKLPTEIFFNDPHSGGDELEWKTEIYMPIKSN